MLQDRITRSDIVASEREIGRWNGPKGNMVKIVDPGYGLFDDKPTPGLIDVHYKCTDVTSYHNCNGAIHVATYGPKVIAFADACIICGASSYTTHDTHTYEPRNEDVLDYNEYELYAD